MENGACHVMSTPAHPWGTIPTLSPFFGWAHSFSSNVKHVPKISSTHFTPQQTPNLQSPLKTSCPPPKFNFRPFSKLMIPFWCVSAYFSRARNLFLLPESESSTSRTSTIPVYRAPNFLHRSRNKKMREKVTRPTTNI